MTINWDKTEAPQSEDTLQAIQRKAKESKSIQDAIDETQETLDQLQARQTKILSSELPELLSNASMAEFKLDDGTTFKVQEILNATVPKDETRRKALFAWLAENDGGGIIKTMVTVPFEKTQHNEALDLAASLSEKGYAAQANEDVHHSTLSKFLREVSERGGSFPSDEICSIYEKNVVKIK